MLENLPEKSQENEPLAEKWQDRVRGFCWAEKGEVRGKKHHRGKTSDIAGLSSGFPSHGWCTILYIIHSVLREVKLCVVLGSLSFTAALVTWLKSPGCNTAGSQYAWYQLCVFVSWFIGKTVHRLPEAHNWIVTSCLLHRVALGHEHCWK